MWCFGVGWDLPRGPFNGVGALAAAPLSCPIEVGGWASLLSPPAPFRPLPLPAGGRGAQVTQAGSPPR